MGLSVLSLHTYRACLCVLALHQLLDFYTPIPSLTLRLHSAVVSGPLFGLHLGGWKGRWEWLVEGTPLTLLGEAMAVSEKGQVVLHHSSYDTLHHLVQVQPIPSYGEEEEVCEGEEDSTSRPSCYLLLGVLPLPTTTASSSSSHSTSPTHTRPVNTRWPHLTISVPQPTLLPPAVHSRWQWSPTGPLHLHHFLHPASPPLLSGAEHRLSSVEQCGGGVFHVWVCPFCHPPASGCWSCGVLAEFRRVTTLFIALPPVRLTGPDAAQQLAAFQARVLCLMSVCALHKGDVRQLLTDDKGTVCILLFGLQASWANPLLGYRQLVLSACV